MTLFLKMLNDSGGTNVPVVLKTNFCLDNFKYTLGRYDRNNAAN